MLCKSSSNSELIKAYAGIAQLIERRLAKAKVTGLSPASRSIFLYENIRRYSQAAEVVTSKASLQRQYAGSAKSASRWKEK